MKTSTIAASLLSVMPVFGADLLGFQSGGCGGGSYQGCNGIPSGYCCNWVAGSGTGPYHGATSGLWSSIPQAATLYAFQSDRAGNSCGTVVNSGPVNPGSYCLTFSGSGQFSGGAWNARSAKFRRAGDSACIGSVDADTLYLPDGTMLDLTKMTNAQKVAVWSGSDAELANAGKLPAVYHTFVKPGKAAPLPEFKNF